MGVVQHLPDPWGFWEDNPTVVEDTVTAIDAAPRVMIPKPGTAIDGPDPLMHRYSEDFSGYKGVSASGRTSSG